MDQNKYIDAWVFVCLYKCLCGCVSASAYLHECISEWVSEWVRSSVRAWVRACVRTYISVLQYQFPLMKTLCYKYVCLFFVFVCLCICVCCITERVCKGILAWFRFCIYIYQCIVVLHNVLTRVFLRGFDRDLIRFCFCIYISVLQQYYGVRARARACV
jgi:hypothetical protein